MRRACDESKMSDDDPLSLVYRTFVAVSTKVGTLLDSNAFSFSQGYVGNVYVCAKSHLLLKREAIEKRPCAPILAYKRRAILLAGIVFRSAEPASARMVSISVRDMRSDAPMFLRRVSMPSDAMTLTRSFLKREGRH